MSKNLLSKSTFIRSLQCQKSLYLYKKHKELQDEISDEQQAIFSRGHSVGFLARQLFPGGADAAWKHPRYYQKSVKLTKKLMDAGCNVIYEAAFVADNVLVAVDILVRDGAGWYMYEVKSSLQPSETFLRDASLQYRVITRAGIQLTGVSLVHLNRNYVRGSYLDLNGLFKIQDVTEQVKIRQAFVLSGIVQAKETLRYQEAPEVSIGPHCNLPYPCDFQNHCWSHVPSDSIFQLSDLEDDRKWKLYNQGVLRMEDIPEDFPLTQSQQIELQSRRSGQPHVDIKPLQAALSKIKFPTAFLDICMARPAVPIIAGTRPYQNIPFQFSLTRLQHICADVQHAHFLAEAGADAADHFIEKFLAETEDLKSIVVYDCAPDIRVLKDMAAQYPEWKAAIEDRLKKVVDLADVFRKKLFYHPGMQQGIGLKHMLAVFGRALLETAVPLNSHYMAGVAFEQLYTAQDFFYLSAVREALQSFSTYHAAALWEVYKAVREEAMQEAPAGAS